MLENIKKNLVASVIVATAALTLTAVNGGLAFMNYEMWKGNRSDHAELISYRQELMDDHKKQVAYQAGLAKWATDAAGRLNDYRGQLINYHNCFADAPPYQYTCGATQSQ